MRSGDERDAVTGAASCAAVLLTCRPDDAIALETRTQAFHLRTQADEVLAHEPSRAAELLTAALQLRPELHTARLSRAAARLATRELDGALLDAEQVGSAPDAPTKLRARAHLAAAGVHLARNDALRAQKACTAAAAVDASILRSKDYNLLVREVATALAAAAQ